MENSGDTKGNCGDQLDQPERWETDSNNAMFSIRLILHPPTEGREGSCCRDHQNGDDQGGDAVKGPTRNPWFGGREPLQYPPVN